MMMIIIFYLSNLQTASSDAFTSSEQSGPCTCCEAVPPRQARAGLRA